MIRYLLISLSLLLAGCATVPALRRPADAQPSDAPVWTPTRRSETERNTYRVVLRTRKNELSGLCILRKNGDTWRGTLMNEFGFKAFDFQTTNSRCELQDVQSMLDKWYIRRTIASDLHFLIECDHPQAPFAGKIVRYEQNNMLVVNHGKKELTVLPDGTLRLVNRRHHLTYELRKLTETKTDNTIQYAE